MQKLGSALFILLTQISLSAADTTYSDTRIENFYTTFVDEEAAIVDGLYTHAANSGGTSNPTPPPPPPSPPPPPPPPTNPLDPAPKDGYLPVVLTNSSGLNDSEIYVTLIGQQTAANSLQYFFQLGKNGVMNPVAGSSSTYSPDFSYQLTEFPRSTTGSHDYLVYAPNLNGARFYFSVGVPMYLQSDTLTATTNQIVAPNYFAFYDPNYNTLYDSIEVTYIPRGGGSSPAIPWTATANTTGVDAFGLPLAISYFSYNPSNPSASTPMIQNPNALPSGFGTIAGASGLVLTREYILASVESGLISGDASGQEVWKKLAIPFYTNAYSGSGLVTYLRILSPKQSVGLSAAPVETGGLTIQHINAVNGRNATTFRDYNYPPFPLDYINNGIYSGGTPYTTRLFAHYRGGTKLYLSTGGTSPTVYEGVTTGSAGSYVLTFTGVSGPHTGDVSVLNQTDMNTFDLYSGVQLMSGTDGAALGHFFCDAFTVGLLPSANGTSLSTPINITDAVTWQPANIPNYYVPLNSATTGGPWMDLYAKLLHAVAISNSVSGDLNGVGLCYGYDFDDSLGISGASTPANTTANTLNPYLGIKIGTIDSTIPNPYNDTTAYDVTFTFPVSPTVTLQYQQGNGAWVSVTNGQMYSGLVSNNTTPLRIRYVNNQGPFAYHEFLLYLYYQMMIPVGSFNSSEIGIINASTITPNANPPTSFVVNLLP